MEKKLKLVLLLSLKEMALRKVGVLLWSSQDILASISKFEIPVFHTDESKKEWRNAIEDRVKEKVPKLDVPKSLTKQIVDLIQPIGVEIRRWKEIHEDIFFGSMAYIDLSDWAKLCWTTAGTIDNKRTAENLVLCESLDLQHRYKMACYYCLEDYIPLFFEELPDEVQHRYQNESSSTVLYICWPLMLKGQLSQLDYLLTESNRNLTSFNQWAFENSIENGRKTAAEYFFRKLKPEEREVSLVRSTQSLLTNRVTDYFGEEMFSSVVCYLLSLMTPEQQVEAIRAHPVEISLCFLDLPLQDIFLENASLVWDCLPPSSYDDLLKRMADKFRYSGHYYPKLFQEFFAQSPSDFKEFFGEHEDEFGDTPASRLLDIFFALEDSESIEVMFRNMDAEDRVKLLFHRHVLGIFYDFISLDKWQLVEMCLREAMLSRDNLEVLKEALTGVFKRCGDNYREYQNLTKFFKHYNETVASSSEES